MGMHEPGWRERTLAPIYGVILNHLDHPRHSDQRQLWRMASALNQDVFRLQTRLQYLKRHGLATYSRVTRLWYPTQDGRALLRGGR